MPEQCFLLGYRALSREIYTKRATAALSDMRRDADKGKTLEAQIEAQESNLFLKVGLDAGLRDQDNYKSIYDGILESQEFDNVRAYIIEFETAPPVMCSGAVYPEQDFEGTELQDLLDLSNTPDLLCFTSFYGGERGVVAFSWLTESDHACYAFIESLKAIPDEFVTAALLRFFFTHCENVHMNPDWWERLPEGNRNALIRRMAMSAEPLMERPKAYLAEDELVLSSWPIVRRHQIQSHR